MRALIAVLSSLTLGIALAACGDHVPESEAAKELGNKPKQTLDAVKDKVNAAGEQDKARNEGADTQ